MAKSVGAGVGLLELRPFISYVTLGKVRIFLYSSNLSSKMGKITVPAQWSGLGIQGLEHGTG